MPVIWLCKSTNHNHLHRFDVVHTTFMKMQHTKQYHAMQRLMHQTQPGKVEEKAVSEARTLNVKTYLK